MSQINPVGWVEIPVSNLDRAEKFYGEFFGFAMERKGEMSGATMSWFPMDEGYGAAGSLVLGEGYVPCREGALVYFTAPEGSVKKAMERAASMDIEVLMDHTDIGEFGFMAIIVDSEDNRIGLHSDKS